MFRLLGTHPGTVITTTAAGSLAGLTPGSACALLRELARCHLVSERRPGRFTLHDLVHSYAAELARAGERS